MLFNEREMSLALAKLFELFSPSDYEAFDEEEIGYAGGLCLPEVCMALKDAVQTVYQYSVTGGYEKSFDYRGVELFNQRGCLILSDVEQMVFDEAETTYATELWLLEDMSFAIVHCVKMKIGSEDAGYVTEYRAFKKPLEISEDLFFSPESLIEELESIQYHDGCVRCGTARYKRKRRYHIRKYCHRCFGIGNNGRNAAGNGFGAFARLVPTILYRAGHDVRFGNHHLCDRLRSND